MIGSSDISVERVMTGFGTPWVMCWSRLQRGNNWNFWHLINNTGVMNGYDTSKVLSLNREQGEGGMIGTFETSINNTEGDEWL